MNVRRRLLSALATGGLVPFLPWKQAHATNESLAPEIRKVIGDQPLRTGRVRLDIPRLADNGHSVPISISVDSPMSAAEYVRSITLLSERNPRPLMATFHFGPKAGKAVVATRVRLAGSQELLAIAALSDGSFWSGTAHVVVTESACLDET